MYYIKLSTKYLKDNLHFKCSQEEQATYFSLMLISREGEFPGYLKQSEKEPYPDNWLASAVGVSAPKFKQHLTKLKKYDYISEDGNGCLKIVEWGLQPKFNKYDEDSPPDNHQRQEVPPVRQAAQVKPPEPPRPKSPSKILDYEETIDPRTNEPHHPEHLRYLELLKKSKYTNAYGEMTEAETAEFDELVSQRRKRADELLAKHRDKDGHYIIKK